MKRIAILDTYYPQFLAGWDLKQSQGYEECLAAVLYESFGTSDFYSRALRDLGWSTLDIVANYAELQGLWAREHHVQTRNLQEIALQQIRRFEPSVVFMQDLSFFEVSELQELKRQKIRLAGQCSCALGNLEKVKCFDVLFTSFPHYISKFEHLGVKVVYLPLAFDPVVLQRTEECERDIDCAFVGGVGWQWENSIPLLEAVKDIPGMQFWGYGFEKVPSLKAKWNGYVWGRQMYQIYRRSKIVLNRHGAIAGGYSNNLRMFEATGCGALLLTENTTNLVDFFVLSNGVNENPEVVAYDSTEDAANLIDHLLNSSFTSEIASNGQRRTLRDHTYSQRMPKVSEVLGAA